GGDGGDEMFGGYDRYKAVGLSQFVNKVPSFLRRFLAGPFRATIPNSTRQRSPLRRARRFLETLGMDALEQYLQWIAIFNRSRLSDLLSADYWRDCAAQAALDDGIAPAWLTEAVKRGERPLASELDSVDFLADAFKKYQRRDLTSAISFTDYATYLTGDGAVKIDVAAGRAGLRIRTPFLDPNIAEFALQTPVKYKIRGKKGKFILRKAFAEFLPSEIDARPKTGFGVPLDHWFRGPLNKMLRETLLDKSSEYSQYFDLKYIETIIKEHENSEFDHSARLWALLVFKMWEKHLNF
ncbi:MAG: hypothetical protein HUK22_07200, partial [Thermoguttaceae bacterium]|nr:hypothetical protein [Thermoguttaceae bacterium]